MGVENILPLDEERAVRECFVFLTEISQPYGSAYFFFYYFIFILHSTIPRYKMYQVARNKNYSSPQVRIFKLILSVIICLCLYCLLYLHSFYCLPEYDSIFFILLYFLSVSFESRLRLPSRTTAVDWLKSGHHCLDCVLYFYIITHIDLQRGMCSVHAIKFVS